MEPSSKRHVISKLSEEGLIFSAQGGDGLLLLLSPDPIETLQIQVGFPPRDAEGRYVSGPGTTYFVVQGNYLLYSRNRLLHKFPP